MNAAGIEKGVGILLHISSLPSNYGIGTFGVESFRFVDFLAKSNQKYWQILPLNPTSYGDSPYQSPSTFAGNPYFIDLETLVFEGLLQKEECDACDFVSQANLVDFEKLFFNRYPLLRKAYQRFDKNNAHYIDFCEKNSFWLEDYSLFMAIKVENNFQGLEVWHSKYPYEEVIQKKDRYADECGFWKFLQFKFFEQFAKLRTYANNAGIQIIGDIPIYVAYDSADVWANPKLFQLDENRLPKLVAGVPPDYFSQTGQLWGNPVFDWEEMQKRDFDWWIKRILFIFKTVDVVRIDHFRGFAGYYAIPYGDKDAKRGYWLEGKGIQLFTKLKSIIPNAKIIAEDLGLLDDSVINLLKFTGFPGMKVLHFAFDSDEENPKNYPENIILYTGTHDNNTTAGWCKNLNQRAKTLFCNAAIKRKNQNQIDALIELAHNTAAKVVIVPMQDYLRLDECARMNMPSTLGGRNWRFRLDKDYVNAKLINHIKKFVNTNKK